MVIPKLTIDKAIFKNISKNPLSKITAKLKAEIPFNNFVTEQEVNGLSLTFCFVDFIEKSCADDFL